MRPEHMKLILNGLSRLYNVERLDDCNELEGMWKEAVVD
jgi:hypothetical protein